MEGIGAAPAQVGVQGSGLHRVDLGSATAATRIGMGCRVCERLDCPQRAAPPLGSPLRIDQDTSTFIPYPVAD